MKRTRTQLRRACKRQRGVESHETEEETTVPWDLLVTDVQHLIVRQHCTPLSRLAMSLTCKAHYRDYELASTTEPCSLLELHLQEIWATEPTAPARRSAYLKRYADGFETRPIRQRALVLVFWAEHVKGYPNKWILFPWLPTDLLHVDLSDLVTWPLPLPDHFLRPYLFPFKSFAVNIGQMAVSEVYTNALVTALRHKCLWLLRWFSNNFEALRQYIVTTLVPQRLCFREWAFPWSDRPDEMVLLGRLAVRMQCDRYLARSFIVTRLLPAASRVPIEDVEYLQRDWELFFDLQHSTKEEGVTAASSSRLSWFLDVSDRHWLATFMSDTTPTARHWAAQWLRQRVAFYFFPEAMTCLLDHHKIQSNYHTLEALSFFWSEILERPSFADVTISLNDWLSHYTPYTNFARNSAGALLPQQSVLPAALPMLEWFLHPDRKTRMNGSVIKYARKHADFTLLHWIWCERVSSIHYHEREEEDEKEERFASNFRAWVAQKK